MLAGLALVAWPHRYKDTATQVAFGASLATGAVVSLAFFVLQRENQANQDRLARRQTFQLSIALQRDLTPAWRPATGRRRLRQPPPRRRHRIRPTRRSQSCDPAARARRFRPGPTARSGRREAGPDRRGLRRRHDPPGQRSVGQARGSRRLGYRRATGQARA